MSKKTIQSVDHKNQKDFNLPDIFLSIKPNLHLLHLSVLRQLSNQRAGTASTKTKSEVRGGGRKPWKQKGTGRARAGSIRSPLWRGGGIAFGPKPRSFKFQIPKKVRILAIAQALVAKASDIITIGKLPEIKDCKTKNFISEIKNFVDLNIPSILFICNSNEANFNEIKKASNNLPNIVLKEDTKVGVFEILKASKVVLTKKSLEEIEKRCSSLSKTSKVA